MSEWTSRAAAPCPNAEHGECASSLHDLPFDLACIDQDLMASEHAKVICAMSGGVDSSVTALLLQQAGHNVLGVTMKLFEAQDSKPGQTADAAGDAAAAKGETDPSSANADPKDAQSAGPALCGSSQDALDAQKVAHALGMEHRIVDFAADFQRCVIDRFCQSYLLGQTPNPCIDCNRSLKFGALQGYRQQLGFDYVATGHYARRCFDPQSGRYLLKTALDPQKDQSYVLYSLTQEELAHTLFPLGSLTKSQARELADQAGLVNAQKAESQDICFVPDGNYLRFIKERTGKEPQPGTIVHVSGKELGTHQGLAAYTIGQRKGIGIAWSEPLYVCGKNTQANQLVVGTKEESLVTRVFVDNVNFISVAGLDQPLRVTAKTFYRQAPQNALAVQTGPTSLELVFDQPIRACAAGQAAVLYQQDVVVAGGTISGCY